MGDRTDEKLLQLYREQDESAIALTKERYGQLCFTIARRILGNDADAEECLSDVLLAAWQRIPEEQPNSVAAYLSRVTRNLAMHRLDAETAAKRGGRGEGIQLLGELESCLPGGEDPAKALDRKLLRETIRAFLAGLPKREREIFLLRYFYAASTQEIAARYGIRTAHVLVILSRTRKRLRIWLEETRD